MSDPSRAPSSPHRAKRARSLYWLATAAVLSSLGLASYTRPGLAERAVVTAAPPVAPAQAPAVAPTAPPTGAPVVDNVVLVTIDSLRADMPWSGYARPIAPNLTAFSQRAVTYTNAYALSSYTSQSVGGFLAGKLPSEIARDGSFFGIYPRSVTFFPELLRAAGVHTLAVQAHFYFRRGYAGFEQGFDQWELLPGLHPDPTTDRDITGDRHEAAAERLLGDPAHTGRRFFAWFHFMDPHDQYLPHRGIGPYGRTLRDRYDAEVTWTDQQVGRLLDFIARQPWASRTAVIISADHGEALGEHGQYRHGFEVWNTLARVPWMVFVPGFAARRIDVNRSHLDLAPTVLALMGVTVPSDMHGVSLVDELRGGAAPERDVWVDLARTGINERRRALVHGRYKLLAIGDDRRFELFDLQSDPGELRSLRSTDEAAYRDMLGRYRAQGALLREVAASNLPPRR